MCKFVNNGEHNHIDKCMKNLIKWFDENENFYHVLACCCGHCKYPITIVVKGEYSQKIFEVLSGVEIPRKRRFYKRDKQGYYYIPEVTKPK